MKLDLNKFHISDKVKHIVSIIQSVLLISGVHISNDEQLIFTILIEGGISQDKLDKIKAIINEP